MHTLRGSWIVADADRVLLRAILACTSTVLMLVVEIQSRRDFSLKWMRNMKQMKSAEKQKQHKTDIGGDIFERGDHLGLKKEV